MIAGATGPVAAPPVVSVVILNRDRPRLLARVLAGLDHLRYPNFEVIVVSDRTSAAALGLGSDMAHRIRHAHCFEPNISRARNLALALAAGEIVAFCDDDAVPEPDWLCRLTEPFADPRVGAAGGMVRGRDGICVQSTGGLFDCAGDEHAVEAVGPDQPARIFPPRPDGQIGFMGVNSAFRRTAIVGIGGFDESFHYFLDETDALMRLGKAGWSVALVPRAEIHHMHVGNASRGRLRKPKDLYQIAASKAYFCARHAADAGAAAIAQFRERRIAALDRFIQLGLMSRAERSFTLDRLDLGLEAGALRAPMLPLAADAAPGGPFRRFAAPGSADRLSMAIVPGWAVGPLAAAQDLARGLAGQGHIVTCLAYRIGRARPFVAFEDGMWLHRGGTWRPGRDARGRIIIHRATRARAEIARVMPRRAFDLALRPLSGRFALWGPPAATLSCPDLGLILGVEVVGARFAAAAALARLAQSAAEALGAVVEIAGPTLKTQVAAPSRMATSLPMRGFDTQISASVSTIRA